jgi:hypothetical protein
LSVTILFLGTFAISVTIPVGTAMIPYPKIMTKRQ